MKIRYVPPDNGERKFGRFTPRDLTQILHSDVAGQNLIGSGTARYFDYESAVALRNLAAAYGTAMPRYLLAPEVAVQLAKVPDLRKRLFIDELWNTGERLNEILPLTRDDFVLDDPASGTPLSSPFVVLRTLKQRRLEEAARGAADGSGHLFPIQGKQAFRYLLITGSVGSATDYELKPHCHRRPTGTVNSPCTSYPAAEA